MWIDGAYSVVYGGEIGQGVAIIRIANGLVEGSDFVGGKYHGTATVDIAGNIDLDISITVPLQVLLVQGTSSQDVPHTRLIKHKFPRLFGDGKPQTIVVPPGTVTVMIKRLPDEQNDLAGQMAVKGFELRVKS